MGQYSITLSAYNVTLLSELYIINVININDELKWSFSFTKDIIRD